MQIKVWRQQKTKNNDFFINEKIGNLQAGISLKAKTGFFLPNFFENSVLINLNFNIVYEGSDVYKKEC